MGKINDLYKPPEREGEEVLEKYRLGQIEQDGVTLGLKDKWILFSLVNISLRLFESIVKYKDREKGHC